MKSWDVVGWGEPLRERERETPAPRGREVLLRITHCGVCHTDVHIRDGYYDLGGGAKLTFAERGFRLPITLGHEPVGEVVAIGELVRDIGLGARFLVNPWIGCGACPRCADGQDNLCPGMRALGMGTPGGFATHMLVPDPAYLVNIDGLRPEQAAPLACSGLTTYSAIMKLIPIDPEEWIAVIGCGGLGLMALALLRALGHERTIACDIDETRLAVAGEAGAARVCRLSRDQPGALVEVADGPLYGILDCVGSAATFELALPALRKGGRLVVCGLYGGTAGLPMPLVALREVSILGSAVGTTRDLVELVELVKRGRVRLPEVRCRPLAMAEQSLADLGAGRVVGRIVLEGAANG